MKAILKDVEKARALAVLVLREAATQGRSVGEAAQLASDYLESLGYPAPDDPIAFATGGKVTLRDGDPQAQLVAMPSGEVL